MDIRWSHTPIFAPCIPLEKSGPAPACSARRLRPDTSFSIWEGAFRKGCRLFSKHLDYVPSIICTGAAIAFLTVGRLPYRQFWTRCTWLAGALLVGLRAIRARYLQGSSCPMVIREKLKDRLHEEDCRLWCWRIHWRSLGQPAPARRPLVRGVDLKFSDTHLPQPTTSLRATCATDNLS